MKADPLKRWKDLDPLERAAWVAAVCLVFAAAAVRPVLRAWSPQTAVDVAAWEQFPANMRFAPGGDPWGAPWARAAALPTDSVLYGLPPSPPVLSPRRIPAPVPAGAIVLGTGAFYSAGPDGQDDGGLGDDLFPLDPGPSTPLLSLWTLLATAVVLVWLVPWIRKGRSRSVGREALRAAFVTGPSAFLALPWAYRLASPEWQQARSRGLDFPVLSGAPEGLSLVVTVVGLAFLVALALRLTRPLVGRIS